MSFALIPVRIAAPTVSYRLRATAFRVACTTASQFERFGALEREVQLPRRPARL